MIVIEIQMAPELRRLFAEVIGSILGRLQGNLPRVLFVPDDPEMQIFWSEDLRRQLGEDVGRLEGLFNHPQFGLGAMSIPLTEAEAICRAASAVRLALRELELGSLGDQALEGGLVQPPELEEPVRRAYYCYWFLGGLQEMLIRALDPSLAGEEEEETDEEESLE